MSAVTLKLLRGSRLPTILYSSSRTATYWNKDWMPGPYPETEEQRLAAAKKYNLLPEEYEPDPDGWGDYPKLPAVSGASRSNYHNWDYPAIKKDCGEPLHVYENMICEERWDINHVEKQKYHPSIQAALFFGTMLLFFLPAYYFEDKKTSLPFMKRHFPSDGVHYKYP